MPRECSELTVCFQMLVGLGGNKMRAVLGCDNSSDDQHTGSQLRCPNNFASNTIMVTARAVDPALWRRGCCVTCCYLHVKQPSCWVLHQ